MQNIDISVITATYNGEKFIKDCIESVRHSILIPHNITTEHIVFDDGSTDDTPKVCLQYEGIIQFYRREQNNGIGATLNEAIAEAKGTYIFVLDHDDVILQRTLHDLYLTLRDGKHNWAYTNFIRSNENLSYIIGEDYYGWKFNSCEETLQAIFNGRHFIQHNVMYSKSLYNDVGGYDENIEVFPDLDLFVRFLLKGHLPYYSPIISHLHRFHESNRSIGHDGDQHLKNIDYLKTKYLECLEPILRK